MPSPAVNLCSTFIKYRKLYAETLYRYAVTSYSIKDLFFLQNVCLLPLPLQHLSLPLCLKKEKKISKVSAQVHLLCKGTTRFRVSWFFFVFSRVLFQNFCLLPLELHLLPLLFPLPLLPSNPGVLSLTKKIHIFNVYIHILNVYVYIHTMCVYIYTFRNVCLDLRPNMLHLGIKR